MFVLFQNPLSSSTLSGSSRYRLMPRARETAPVMRIEVISSVPVEVSPKAWTELNSPLLTTMAAYRTSMKVTAASIGAAVENVDLFFL